MPRTSGRGPQAYDAEPYVPEGADLSTLRLAAAGCQGCPLFRDATQTVFGSGDASARVVLLGEQPGDREDRRGEPFVGPAGRLLTQAVAEAGIDPAQTYLTNAVKHFKFTLVGQGKRRIHKAPNLREMTACRPWLVAELNVIGPEVIVALGATAGKALFGASFRVTGERGVLLPMPDWDEHGRDGGDGGSGGVAGVGGVVATLHPSAVLRADDDRDAVYAGLVRDLRVAAEVLA